MLHATRRRAPRRLFIALMLLTIVPLASSARARGDRPASLWSERTDRLFRSPLGGWGPFAEPSAWARFEAASTGSRSLRLFDLERWSPPTRGRRLWRSTTSRFGAPSPALEGLARETESWIEPDHLPGAIRRIPPGVPRPGAARKLLEPLVISRQDIAESMLTDMASDLALTYSHQRGWVSEALVSRLGYLQQLTSAVSLGLNAVDYFGRAAMALNPPTFLHQITPSGSRGSGRVSWEGGTFSWSENLQTRSVRWWQAGSVTRLHHDRTSWRGSGYEIHTWRAWRSRTPTTGPFERFLAHRYPLGSYFEPGLTAIERTVRTRAHYRVRIHRGRQVSPSFTGERPLPAAGTVSGGDDLTAPAADAGGVDMGLPSEATRVEERDLSDLRRRILEASECDPAGVVCTVSEEDPSGEGTEEERP